MADVNYCVVGADFAGLTAAPARIESRRWWRSSACRVTSS